MAPPKPRLVLRIGVTGHRPNRFGPEAQAIVAAKLDTVLQQVSGAAAALHLRYGEMFTPEPPEVRLVSALAEGADRVAAEAALKRAIPLDVILPFAPSLYAEDFVTAEAKAAFSDLLGKAHACLVLPGTRSPDDPAVADRAYEAVGLMTLRQTDLIIAVWDGKDTAGRGGTGSIIQSALASGQPVLWFDAEGNGPFLLSGGEAVMSDARDTAERASGAVGADEIGHVVARLCAPPGGDGNAKAAKRLRRFLGESEHRVILFGFWYPLILKLFGKRKGLRKSFFRPPYLANAEADWRPYWQRLESLDARLKRQIGNVVLTRFAWADRLADHYGQLHRSGYISNYLLAALAVLCAAAGSLFGQPSVGPSQAIDLMRSWIHTGAPWCEVAIIIFIGITTARGRFGGWHTRWLDYRHLSAQLRALRALVLTGSATGEARSPHSGERVESGSEWTGWYCRLSAREVGLPDLAVDAAYVEMVRRAIRAGELDDQIGYHKANAVRMKRVHRWLDGLSHLFFIVTFLACVYEALGPAPFILSEESKILPFLCIVLPAVGAALFGISVHGEFALSAERSEHMVEQLAVLAERLGGQEAPSFATVSALTEYAAMTMASEIGAWQVIYRARPLALPA